nr:hypothetical protein [Tanacetum cinerariifolium]
MMTDNRTMAELLRAPTERYAKAIVVPPILAEHFELKHSLINMMTTDQFFGLEKDNPHDQIRWGSPPVAKKRTPAFYYHMGRSYQDSLNAAAGGNLLERSTQDVLTIIENKSKVRNSRSKPIASQVKACDVNSNSSEIAKLTHAVNQQTNAVTIAMTAILKQFQATPPPAPVKAAEQTCVTCGGVPRLCFLSGCSEGDYTSSAYLNKTHKYKSEGELWCGCSVPLSDASFANGTPFCQATASQPQSDQQSFHLIDETEDEPNPTPTSKKMSRGPRMKSKAKKTKEKEAQVEAKKRARIVWSHEEELILAEIFIQISEDPRVEDMKVLQINTRGIDPDDAAIINAQKERIRAVYPPSN